MMDERDLSPGEVASKLGVSERTVLREIHAGALVAHRVRGVWRIEADEVRAYRARNLARIESGEAVMRGRH